jgi:hypothetical protein
MTWERFKQAQKLGPLALIRLRAEVLLERDNIVPQDHEELVRIATEPKLDDCEYLVNFDHLFERDE